MLKVKLKGESVNDVGSMSLYPNNDVINSKYCIALLNSNLIFDYYRVFINCTVNIQINDLRQLPIIIPSEQEMDEIVSLVDKAIEIKKKESIGILSESVSKDLLFDVEEQIDRLIFWNLSNSTSQIVQRNINRTRNCSQLKLLDSTDIHQGNF